MELHGGISFALNQAKVGRKFRVLVDKAEAGQPIARTEHDPPELDNEVLIPTEGNYLRIGDFAHVRITEAREHELVGGCSRSGALILAALGESVKCQIKRPTDLFRCVYLGCISVCR